jgi:hypothetical protein
MREIRTSGLMSGDGRRGFATAPILDSTGNDAPDIGDARSLIRPYAEITCISRDSHVSTEVECQFVPRS